MKTFKEIASLNEFLTRRTDVIRNVLALHKELNITIDKKGHNDPVKMDREELEMYLDYLKGEKGQH